MKKRQILWTAAALLAASLPARAGVSLDPASPSIGGCGFVVTPANLYRLVAPGGGCDVGGAGPQSEVMPPSLGLGAMDNVDAVSANTFTPRDLRYYLVFSGDVASVGQPATPYTAEAALNQAAADLWRTPLTNGNPLGSMAACAPVPIPPPQALHRNQTAHNLIPTVASGIASGIPQDDIDGIELDVMDVTGDQIHDGDLYFSLDAGSPALGGGSPALIFFSPAGAGAFGVFSGPGMLGLLPGDDIDALVIWDRGALGVANPGVDLVLFSLAPGSPTLGMIGGSAANIYVSDFAGVFCPFTQANQLGLLGADNVDGLDVIH